MYNLLHRIFGFYEVAVPKENAALLLNTLAKYYIYYWNARPTATELLLRLSLFSCRAAEDAANHYNIPIRAVRECGMPFIARRYQRRYGIYLGIAAGCFLLFVSQLFVWKVTVIGNEKLATDDVTRILRECGVYVGCFIPDIMVYRAEADVMRLEDDISSISINLRGTEAEIVLIERVHAPKAEDKSGFCNLVASESGRIVKIEATKGKPVVKVGDEVTEGQELVSGFVTTKRDNTYCCRSAGHVWAEVERTFSVTVPKVLTQKRYTGREMRISEISFLGRRIDILPQSECKFALFDAVVSEREFTPAGLSTTIVKSEMLCREYEYSEFTIDSAAAEYRCLAAFANYLESTDDEVIDYSYEIVYDEKNGVYVLNAHTVVLCDIARESFFEEMLP